MKKLFGTDGIRAVAGSYPLDPPTIVILGRALVELLREEGLEAPVVIGRDTRESGPWIEKALAQGIASGGGEFVSAGIIPTSAVSFLTRKHRFSAGIAISASHNPYRDNGIKIFSPQGFKISDELELRLEKAILGARGKAFPSAKDVIVRPRPELGEDYGAYLTAQLHQTAGPRDFTMVVDCANGASSTIAPLVFFRLGFKVIPIAHTPDGRNINRKCGSLHPQGLARLVVDARANLGVAYDGDADRAIWVDERGRILNGDHTLFIQAGFMKRRGWLKTAQVVATTMSNMGLEKSLRDLGLELVRTRVGDKYVLEKMIALGANLGGEQSGHTIFLDDCPTGDGILTSVKMLETMLTSETRLSELASGLPEFPQVLRNVRVREKADWREFPEILGAMDEVKSRLAGVGRLDVRYSGTEPMARVMIEGEDKAEIEALAKRLISVIAKYLGE
ncbi:MAG: phosphoglucosamine mutase [Acidobacteriota bacterium]